MSAIVLPGSIPGLLRRGSPVVIAKCEQYGRLTPFPGVVAPYGVPEGDAWAVAFAVGGPICDAVRLPVSDLDLDLTDATGRAHAAWWLARRAMDDRDYRYVQECGAYWRGSAASNELRWVVGSWMGIASRVFVAPSLHVPKVGLSGFHPDEDPAGAVPDPNYTTVPALADLDPADPRLLPDGSRWVDAEALRRVVLHVAGVQP